MKKQKAFTLIELLVVIAMIAVLMAILMPALRAAKSQARKVVCMAHVKQLVMTVKLYITDHDGKTHDSPNNGLWDNAWQSPSVKQQYGPNDNYAYWGIAYIEYAKSKKIFRCPDTQRVDDWPEWGAPWGFPSQDFFKYCSYGINGYIADKKIEHEFKKHSEVIAFQDHIEQRLDSIDSDMFCIGPGKSINLPQWRPSSQGGDGFYDSYWTGHDAVKECFRHRGVSITSWLDGHASQIKQTTGEDIPTRWYTGLPRGQSGIQGQG
ncbi:MAG: type II secretion system protein [Planctomycetota bacterium]|jgi:prepilin-type N-terminal cleavage/methylation domain-containing protein